MKARQFGPSRVMILAIALTLVALLATSSGAVSKEQLLHAFSGNDGASPEASLIFDAAGNLYGTSVSGGTDGVGAVFKLTHEVNGKWTESVLHTFSVNNGDGQSPYAGLIFDKAGSLYGTTHYGGTNQVGTVFKLIPGSNGKWTETILHSFNGPDGSGPDGQLVFDAAGNLYGTTYFAGANYNAGTVFKLTPEANGTWSETVLHSFNYTDGAHPYAGLILDAAGNLYGTTYSGGKPSWPACIDGCGKIFKLARGKNGQWTYTVLYSFRSTVHDGSYPYGGLILDRAGNLYGTTNQGGAFGGGTVFKLAPGANGTWTETVLHSFNGKDGFRPTAGLVFDATGDLFGTTSGDFTHNSGTVFKLAIGSNHKWIESVLHSFSGKDGGFPSSGLIFDQTGSLYGTTSGGGNLNTCSGGGCGVVFATTP